MGTHPQATKSQRTTRTRWLATLSLCVLSGLAGCADQGPSFSANAAGTVGDTAQVVSDLTFLFR
jgi:hypothetical protein